jgi:hypothetical protein
LFVKILYVQTGKKPLPNHFIGSASYNKVKSSTNNILFALEIHLCDFKLLLAEFKKCKGVLIAFLHFAFLKQFKPVKIPQKLRHNIPFNKQGYKFFSSFL